MTRLLTACLTLTLVLPLTRTLAAEPGFAKTTIDFGVVVSDVEKSLSFYTDVVGFTHVGNFTVSPQIANDAGLSQITKPVKIETLKLGTDAWATTVKLMQIPDPAQKPADNTYIHSQRGISYMTIFVTDTTAALKRAAKHGIKPLAKGPVDLGGGKMYLTLLKDPDGNFVELVGPLGE